MLEQCDFMELTEEVLQQCKGFTCKDEDITEFFTQDYADYAYQLLGKSYCFVKPDTSEIVCAFTVANSSVKVDSLPSNLRNKLNRKIPNAKRRPQYPAVLVGQLAVSDLFSGHHVGDELLDFIAPKPNGRIKNLAIFINPYFAVVPRGYTPRQKGV